MKEWSDSTILGCPWNVASLAVWKKYPNPFAPFVSSTDILDRHVDEMGRLHTLRLFTVHEPITWPLNKLLDFATGGGLSMHMLERSIVDPVTRTHTSHSVNLSMNSLCLNHELIEYSQQSENNTKMVTDIIVDVKACMFFDAEEYMVSRYQSNRVNGLRAINHTISAETITEHHDKFMRQINETLPLGFSKNHDRSIFRRNIRDLKSSPLYSFRIFNYPDAIWAHFNELDHKQMWDDFKLSLQKDVENLSKSIDEKFQKLVPDTPVHKNTDGCNCSP
ncbi:Protein slowmo 1 [Thelohanellus kitauei]|uniref:Protein slowmo 1 n=1 Tax=Thelohanellus kitauei TaxID=669202 RepID=A0A0C2IM00_THEKT|nr:Protein slowmo 1 [Thelohanellus kitauei]